MEYVLSVVVIGKPAQGPMIIMLRDAPRDLVPARAVVTVERAAVRIGRKIQTSGSRRGRVGPRAQQHRVQQGQHGR